jgi:lysophospholipase L1-like esterase
MNLWHAIYQPRERDMTLIERPERWRPFERALRTLTALVRANGARLVVVTQPRSTSAQVRYAEEAPAIDAANAVARRVAASVPEMTLLDLAEDLTGQNDLYTDLAHMTAAGQQAKARAIARVVVSVLRDGGVESVRAPGEGAVGVAR